MSAEQEVINAQVDVNRAVWAVNMGSQVDDYKHKTFKSDREREKYIIQCCQDAIKSLKSVLTEYGAAPHAGV